MQVQDAISHRECAMLRNWEGECAPCVPTGQSAAESCSLAHRRPWRQTDEGCGGCRGMWVRARNRVRGRCSRRRDGGGVWVKSVSVLAMRGRRRWGCWWRRW